MSTSKVFKKFYSKLVEILPMSNATFIAILYSNDLISRELKNQLNLPHRTSAEKATLFLDSVIEPSVTVSGNCFDELLNVMEDNDHQGMKELARQIRTSLRDRSNWCGSDNG